MLIDKEEAAKIIKKQLKKFLLDPESKQKFVKITNEKFNIPTGDVTDYVADRLPVEEADIFHLFILAYGIDDVLKTNLLTQLFTITEIKEFSRLTIETEDIKFPLIFKCVPVGDNQWIGAFSARYLMKLREAQKINYNKNAQRVMTRVVKDGRVSYKITINERSVREIKKAMEAGTYIPDTITLNIPENEFDFRYDKNSMELTINSIDMFDLADGYHRYLAMSRIYDQDKSFNYPMSLQILHYSDDQILQFVYQQDQKTQMKKIDSDSMDRTSPSNQVVERLQYDSRFYLQGSISRDEGKINYGELARCIDYFYYNDIPHNERSRNNNAKFVLTTEPIIRDKFNQLLEDYPELLDTPFDFKSLMIIFYCFKNFTDRTETNMHITTGIHNKDQLPTRVFSTRKPRKGMLKYITEII